MDNSQKKKLGLLAALALASLLVVPQLLESEPQPQNNKQQVQANKEIAEISNENTGEKKKSKKKSVSKDKLEIENLTATKPELTSFGEGDASFINLSELNRKKKIKKEDEKTLPSLPEQVTLPDTIPEINQSPVFTEAKLPRKENEVSKMHLKAIAQSGNKIIAIIEYNGKKTTAFVGSMVGSEFVVTDIDGDKVHLQSLSGQTATLKLSR